MSVAVAMVCLASAATAPAMAALGGDALSVEADRAHLAATTVATTYAAYTAYALTLPNGGVVKEFAARGGAVFALSWRGPGRPDLRQLLGARFAQFQSDNTAPVRGRRRRPLAVDRAEFIVHTGGHAGAFWGVAYLPQQSPEGFSVKDMQ